MNRIYIVTFIALNSSIAFGQGVFITPDSSRLVFPNKVAIDFTKRIRRTKSMYELTPLAMRTLLVQCNFVNRTLALAQERTKLMEKELVNSDSTVQTLNAQLGLANERLLVYSAGLNDLKSVSAAYDNQVKQLIADLDLTRKETRKSNRKKFLQGLAAGLVVTAVYVIVTN